MTPRQEQQYTQDTNSRNVSEKTGLLGRSSYNDDDFNENDCKTSNFLFKILRIHHQQYHKASLDSMCCHFLLGPCLGCCEPVLYILHRIRWFLSKPLRIPVLPRYCRFSIPGNDITYGQLLFNLPTLILLPYAIQTCTAPTALSVNLSGVWATLAMWIAFWTANKTNAFATFVFGISFEQMINTHYLASALTVIVGIYHGYLAYLRWGIPYEFDHDPREEIPENVFQRDFVVTSVNETTGATTFVPRFGTYFSKRGSHPNGFRFAFDGWINWSGTYLTIAFVVLLVSSILPSWRRRFYNQWFLVHIVCCLAVLYFGYVHFKVSLFVIITWAIDLILRYGIMTLCRYPQTATLSVITNDVVCIEWKRTKWFSYNAGQFMKISIPQLSIWEFHPMSIASVPYEDTVRVYIRALGPWSAKLLKLESGQDHDDYNGNIGVNQDIDNDEEKISSTPKKRNVRVLLEGPYGCLSVDTHNPSIALFVCGGIGITPCQSIARSLLYQHRERLPHGRSNLMSVRFVWAIRELELLDKVLAPELLENTDVCSNTIGSNHDDKDARYDYDRLVETIVYHTRGDPSIEPYQKTNTTRIVSGCRPDLEKLFHRTKEEAIQCNITSVKVFSCGPSKLVKCVKETCHEHSGILWNCTNDKPTITFELHEEEYEF